MGQRRLGHDPRQVTDGPHVDQQEECRRDGYQEFNQHPIVPEQALLGTQGLDKPGQRRSKTQRNNDEPASQLHRQIGGPHHLRIAAGETGDGESQERGDRAEPADRGSDMRGERELTTAA